VCVCVCGSVAGFIDVHYNLITTSVISN